MHVLGKTEVLWRSYAKLAWVFAGNDYCCGLTDSEFGCTLASGPEEASSCPESTQDSIQKPLLDLPQSVQSPASQLLPNNISVHPWTRISSEMQPLQAE